MFEPPYSFAYPNSLQEENPIWVSSTKMSIRKQNFINEATNRRKRIQTNTKSNEKF